MSKTMDNQAPHVGRYVPSTLEVKQTNGVMWLL